MYQINILEYLEVSARNYPDKIAFFDGSAAVSFADLERNAMSIGSFLLEKGKCREPILVLMEKHPDTVCAMLGTLYSGCFYICADGDIPSERILNIALSNDVKTVIFDEKNRDRAERLLSFADIFLYDDIGSYQINSERLEYIRRISIDTDPVYISFTSGSSGEAKGVVGTHRAVIDYTEALCTALGFSEDSVFGSLAPLSYDAPLKEIMPTLKKAAATCFIPRRFVMFPIRLLEFMEDQRINTVCWAASAFSLVSSLGALDSKKPTFLKKICFGSEPFVLSEYKKWLSACPDAEFINLYGPTEATGMSAYWIADREIEEGEPIPIGKPFKNTEILLMNSDGKSCEGCEVGEIYIRGSCVTQGYYGKSVESGGVFLQNPLNSKFRDIVYKTGDLAKYNKYGELICLGRADAQIKHLGHRIELGEIEALAGSIDGIIAVCALYDSDKRKIILCYVGEKERKDISDILKARLPTYMLPSIYKRLESMPMKLNGKLDRQAISELCFGKV